MHTPENDQLDTWSSTVRCVRWWPSGTLTNATKLAWGSSGVASGVTCDVGIYSSDGSTKIASAGGVACDGFPVTKTGLSVFTLTADTAYRLCWCASAATISYTSITSLGTASTNDIVNAFIANQGTTPETCPSGILPATTGTITPATSWRALLLYISTE